MKNTIYKVNDAGLVLIGKLNDAFKLIDELGIFVDHDEIEDNSLWGIATSLDVINDCFKNSISEEKIINKIGCDVEPLLPYLDVVV
jgi:hypothetical protein